MSKPSTNIQFHFLLPVPSLKNRNRLKEFLNKLVRKEGMVVEHVNYIFCSDEYLLGINKDHLKHDYYTDIITFQLSPSGAPILSDIYISIDRVRDNATQFGSGLMDELHRVMFHGMLHNCGYKDKTRKDSQLMRSKEDEYLQLYNVSRGTQ